MPVMSFGDEKWLFRVFEETNGLFFKNEVKIVQLSVKSLDILSSDHLE